MIVKGEKRFFPFFLPCVNRPRKGKYSEATADSTPSIFTTGRPSLPVCFSRQMPSLPHTPPLGATPPLPCKKLFSRSGRSRNDLLPGFFSSAPANRLTGLPCQQQRASRDSPGRLLIFAPQAAPFYSWLPPSTQDGVHEAMCRHSARAKCVTSALQLHRQAFATKMRASWLRC